MGAFVVVPSGVSYAACIIIPLGILLGGFRLLFHPLGSYPGPFLGKLTNAYSGYFAARGDLHLVTHRNFQKYGPVIRQAPNRLLFNTVSALRDIYVNPNARKGDAYRSSHLRSKYPSLVNVIDKDQHRRKRRIIGRVFAERSMSAFEPTMVKQIEGFLQLLLASSQDGGAVNMTKRCYRLAVDIAALLGFGFVLDTQHSETFRFLPAMIDLTSWRTNIYMNFPLVWGAERVLVWLGTKQAMKFGDMITTIIKTRMAQDKDAHHDLYSIVADDVGKDQEGLYQDELWPEALLFILAGGTTTAATMAALFFYLSRNPAQHAALADEIRSTFGSAAEILPGPQLRGCRYLRACLDEAMRMSPPALAASWREQDGGTPLVVDGHVIPPGVQVAVNVYALFHNPAYFPDPFAFRPERWLGAGDDGDDDDEQDHDHDHDDGEVGGGGAAADVDRTAAARTMRRAFAPFLIGDRSCAGKNMAYTEMSITIARTLWYFDFERAPGKDGELGGGQAGRTDGRGRPDEYQLKDRFIAVHEGPNLVFRPRGDFWKELQTDE